MKTPKLLIIVAMAAVSLIYPFLALAECPGGVIQNTSNNSTVTLEDTANGQCLINSGIISPVSTGYALNSYYNSFSLSNTGTINLTGTGASALTTFGGNSPLTTSGYMYNSGTIIASGSADIYAIWPYTGTGTIDSIVNSGVIQMTNTGQSVGIFNYANNTITTLTNSGTISTTGDGFYGIGNNSHITTLNNSGFITTRGTSNGISNNNSGSSIIDTINNTGTISAVHTGQYGILNNGVIGTLNNSQGVGNSAGALTYTGVLPTNYNIIINSDGFGQLSGTSVTSSTAFGIFSGSLITSRAYASVLQGLTTSNVGATRTGVYDGMTWVLSLQSGSSTTWDLIFSGASITGTQSSIHSLASKLRGAFSSQVVATNYANMNTYDCNLFDAKGLCVSVGGQQTYVDNPSSSNMTSAVVVTGYKVSPTLRIGGFLNQNLNNHTSASVVISNDNPLMGLFAVWNQNEDQLGYQFKIANAYQDKDVTTIREVTGTSEAGRGSAELNTQSYVGELSYAFLANEDKTLLRPYAAVRYTRIKQDAYTEEATAEVTAPLTYSALSDSSTAALVGVKVDHKLAEKLNLKASLGVEQDLYHHVDNLTATGVSGLTSENFNDNIKRTRPVASIGAYYMPVKNQRIAADLYYQQLPFQSTASTTAYVNYMIGF